MSKAVFVVTLLCVRDRKLLLVKKKGQNMMILPGGKPEADEYNVRSTLIREVAEELKCVVYASRLTPCGVFVDNIADEDIGQIAVMCFKGDLYGEPIPSNEIESIYWYDIDNEPDVSVSPSLKNHIIPFVKDNFLKEENA